MSVLLKCSKTLEAYFQMDSDAGLSTVKILQQLKETEQFSESANPTYFMKFFLTEEFCQQNGCMSSGSLSTLVDVLSTSILFGSNPNRQFMSLNYGLSCYRPLLGNQEFLVRIERDF